LPSPYKTVTHNLFKRLILAFLVFAWPLNAWSLVPSAEELLTGVTAKRVSLDSLEAVYEFTARKVSNPPISSLAQRETIAASSPANQIMVREAVFFRAPDRIRLNLSWPDREEVFLAANLHTLALAGDQAIDAPWPQPFLLFRLLTESEATRLRDLLLAFDFSLNKVSLGRDGQRIVFVLGAGSGDQTLSQVWFDRRNLRLTRLILASKPGQAGYDVRLADYRLYEQQVDWPRLLVTRFERGPGVELRLKSLSINPRVEEKHFDLEEIKQTVAPAPDPSRSLANDPDLKKIRKMMEWFRKKLE
ncbi:MAG: hypothetical protein SV487_13350, partial [Thermodesulfobacteriota bacterium]|nr:hypothetical protein [Thermodesulfobacteriota bacterium]